MKKYFTIYASTILFYVLLTNPLQSLAQSGSLDLSFDTDGIVTTPIGSSDAFGRSIAIQSDGKIVVAGYSDNGTQDVFAITRYNTNGSLDSTFNTDGIVNTAIGTSGNRAHALAIQNDGKIVAAGYASITGTSNDFALARYNTTGSLDTTFDTDGKVTTAFGQSTNDRAFAIAIQGNGKIVVAGYNTNSLSGQRDFAVTRYNTNGSLDTTFNSNGIVSLSIASGMDECRSVMIQTDGKIVVAGFSFDFTTRVFAAVRFNTDGSLDNSFDNDGIVTTAIGSTDDAGYAAALQSDGKIVVTGYTYGAAKYDFALIRYNTDGSLDSTFDTDGKVTTSIGTAEDLPFALAIQPDGKIIAAGHSQNAFNNFALVRYNTNGSLDNSFDGDGKVTTNIGSSISDDIIQAIALQSDGKIVVAGQTSDGTIYDFALARYFNNGTTGINSTDNNNYSYVLFPNPFINHSTLKLNQSLKSATLNIYNINGELVLQYLTISGQSTIINRDQLSSGLYFIQIIDNDKIILTDKIIITD
ncbi:MAG: T9SS type A sorting domain-containing protein [Bacteroidetes bacterium]|nr:T9SS type A sorting domain-containing protein [Bacteroidota bacterium]